MTLCAYCGNPAGEYVYHRLDNGEIYCCSECALAKIQNEGLPEVPIEADGTVKVSLKYNWNWKEEKP